MMTVREVERRTGVSIRALHHYDEIGLLKPTAVTEAGYRLYDAAALERLQCILLFRELQFPLKQIRDILESPRFDRRRALEQQLELLKLKREQLDELISLARKTLEEGVITLDFKAFDKEKQNEYARRAREQWGDTPQYRASEEKRSARSDAQEAAITEHFMDLFAEFGRLRGQSSDAAPVRAQVKKLQDFISLHYYPCSDEILASLGEMYAAEGEMKDNIDAAGGAGCADFAAAAIKAYLRA